MHAGDINIPVNRYTHEHDDGSRQQHPRVRLVLFSSLLDTTSGMPARAGRAAAGPGGDGQAEGEREGGIQEGEGDPGHGTQRASEEHRCAAGGTEREPRERGGDAEETGGGVESSSQMKEHRVI